MSATTHTLKSIDYAALQQCMHCGMCLPSCPTYVATGRERHSPRGRISLMRAIADDSLPLSEAFAEEMSACLGCLACTSACPAGVDYSHLLETARSQIESSGLKNTPKRNFIRWLTLRQLFMKPRLLRATGRALWLWQASGLQAFARKTKLTRLLPAQLRALEPSTPTMRRRFSNTLIAPLELPRHGLTRFRVLVLTGCMQDLMYSEINRATVDVLIENGCEVHTPTTQHCCGSLHAHNGDLASAEALARAQLDQIDPFIFDAIISNAGGCGSHLRHYHTLLAHDTSYAHRASEWSRKLRDIHEWLVEIGFRAPKASGLPPHTRLTYHDSCHLCHGQKITHQPRTLLKSLPGIELAETTESTWCCGSAGIYTITQPTTAAWLQKRKIGHIQATKASLVTTANPGCHLQIETGLRQTGDAQTQVAHPVVLLANAYHAESTASGSV